MTELEKVKQAKLYMDKLANGINPIDNSIISEDHFVNNIHLSRCFFYISDILRQVIDNNGAVSAKKKKKAAFSITYDAIRNFPFSYTTIPASKIAELLNSLIDTENMNKITYKHITDWLISIDMLKVETTAEGKTVKRPTESGNEIGISTEQRIGRNGNYAVVVYNCKAQEFVIDNIDAIISFMNQ